MKKKYKSLEGIKGLQWRQLDDLLVKACMDYVSMNLAIIKPSQEFVESFNHTLLEGLAFLGYKGNDENDIIESDLYRNFRSWYCHMHARMTAEYHKNGWHKDRKYRDTHLPRQSVTRKAMDELDESIRFARAYRKEVRDNSDFDYNNSD